MAELLSDSPPGQWVDDVLLGFQRMTIPLGEDDEGIVSATLVRMAEQHRPEVNDPQASSPPVLYLHGWSDYFYNSELALRMEAAGYRFYALDLRKYGRSMRVGQTPGYVETLETYDDEIGAALHQIAAEQPHPELPILAGHSTGGLVAALWADRHPHQVRALILNSPWLELIGAGWVRTMATAIVDPVRRISPKSTMVLPKANNYWRTLSNEAEGEWSLHSTWRPEYSFDVPRAWLSAVLQGHRQVASGLTITAPILSILSDRSYFGPAVDKRSQTADIILDVRTLARRSVNLGREVTVVRLPNALHDVFASAPDIRQGAFDTVVRWLDQQLA